MKVIAISGWVKSGKDTAAEHLIKNFGFKRMAFADYLKEKVAADFCLEKECLHKQELKEKPILEMPVMPKDKFALNIVKFMFKEFRAADGRRPLDLHIDPSGAVLGVMEYPGIFNHIEETAQLYWTPRALAILEGSTKRTADSNYWVNNTIDNIDALPYDSKVVISDLRYRSELQPLRDFFKKDLITVRVNRFDTTESVDPSERDLDNAQFDVVIENKGTLEEFLKKVEDLVK